MNLLKTTLVISDKQIDELKKNMNNPKSNGSRSSKSYEGRTLKANMEMQIIADDKYLEEVKKHSEFNRERRESDAMNSLLYADKKYVK